LVINRRKLWITIYIFLDYENIQDININIIDEKVKRDTLG